MLNVSLPQAMQGRQGGFVATFSSFSLNVTIPRTYPLSRFFSSWALVAMRFAWHKGVVWILRIWEGSAVSGGWRTARHENGTFWQRRQLRLAGHVMRSGSGCERRRLLLGGTGRVVGLVVSVGSMEAPDATTPRPGKRALRLGLGPGFLWGPNAITQRKQVVSSPLLVNP